MKGLRHCINIGVLWWRRRRDLNPRCTFAHYSLSRGAPSATWVLLHGTGQPMKFCLPGRETGGERGIRTPGTFRYHWFSRPAPSTARPSLLIATSEGYYSMLPALRQSFFPNTFPTREGRMPRRPSASRATICGLTSRRFCGIITYAVAEMAEWQTPET